MMRKNIVIQYLFVIALFLYTSLYASITLHVHKQGKKTERHLSESEKQAIQKKYHTLGAYDGFERKELFQTSFLKKYRQVASFVTNPPTRSAHCKAKTIEVVCDEGHTAQVYYFDRKSDVLLVAGPGFGFAKEVMAVFAEIFPTYDLLLLEHRGHGINVLPQTVSDQAMYALIDVVPSLITWGKKESSDVQTIVKNIRHKRHKQVVGLGFCYSSLIFTAAQNAYPGLFTHLVLDGPIVNLAKTFKALQNDQEIRDQVFPQMKQSSLVSGFNTVITKGLAHLAGMAQMSPLDNKKQCTSIKTPVLFWHGSLDPLVSASDFDTLLKACSNRYCCAIVTHNRHLVNHLKEKELYCWSVEQFLASKL